MLFIGLVAYALIILLAGGDMSLTLDLIVETLPEEDADAWARIEALQSEYAATQSDPCEPLIALHQRLTAQHPCLTSFTDGDPDEQCIWADGPLLGNFKARMGRVALVTHHLGTSLAFVVEQAHALGITVVDWMNDGIWRPERAQMEESPVAKAEPPALTKAKPRWVTRDDLLASKASEGDRTMEWFDARYPNGVEFTELFRAFANTEHRDSTFVLSAMFRRMPPLEAMATLLACVGADEAGAERLKASAGVHAEEDCAPAISHEQGKIASASGWGGMALTVHNDATAFAEGKDAKAISLGWHAPAVATGDNSMAVSFAQASHAVASGYNGVAVSAATHGVAMTGDGGATAINLSGDAMTIDSAAKAISMGYGARAITLGPRADAICSGRNGEAAAYSTGSLAISLGGDGRARAGAGGAIVLVRRDNRGALLDVRCAKVGQNGIKANTWYSLNEQGEFEEVM